MAHNKEVETVEPGETVYNRRGRPVGRITGVTDTGYEFETLEEAEDVETIPGKEFGEGYIMWRCTECGEMGELDDGLPSACPSCGTEKEALTSVVED